jgi:hypothetical protein
MMWMVERRTKMKRSMDVRRQVKFARVGAIKCFEYTY